MSTAPTRTRTPDQDWDAYASVNQRFAEAADEVYWMVFGQPLRVK